MRYILQSLILFFLISASILNGQNDVSIRKKDFKHVKQGFNEAWKHVQQGDSYFLSGGIWFGNAFDEYLKAIVYNNSNAELNYKTGVSALFSDKKEESAAFLLKALELKKDVSKDILLMTARSLQYEEKFPESKSMFNEFLNSQGKKPEKEIILAKKCIEECDAALIVIRDTLRVSIENPGANLNSGSDDYSLIITPDGKTIYFASRREIPQSGSRYSDTKFDENIFISSLNNNTWEPAANAGKNISSKFCETPLYINKECDRLYIYAGYENDGDIKMSVKKKGKWKDPVAIPFPVNSKEAETSFCFSPSGNEIYFVTTKGKDNFGGKDIYFIQKINKRKWSKPRNAGGNINTVYDEESVRFSKTGDTLWFSSKGHNTLGGFDVFYSVRNPGGEWDTVKNLGYPVNTPWDEIFFNPSPSEDSTFYFVSNRKGGLGGLDIYIGRINPVDTLPYAIPIIPALNDTIVAIDTLEKSGVPIPSIESNQPVMQLDSTESEKVNTEEPTEPEEVPLPKPGSVFNMSARTLGFKSNEILISEI